MQCRGTTSVAANGPRGFGVAVGQDSRLFSTTSGLTTVFFVCTGKRLVFASGHREPCLASKEGELVGKAGGRGKDNDEGDGEKNKVRQVVIIYTNLY